MPQTVLVFNFNQIRCIGIQECFRCGYTPYTLSYANAIFSRISYCFTPKLFTFFNTMIINTILFVWIFYIALLYQNYLFGEHVSSIIPWDSCMLILKQIDCSINALATTMQAVSFHIDTLFGCVKPIHQTGLAILTLRI